MLGLFVFAGFVAFCAGVVLYSRYRFPFFLWVPGLHFYHFTVVSYSKSRCRKLVNYNIRRSVFVTRRIRKNLESLDCPGYFNAVSSLKKEAFLCSSSLSVLFDEYLDDPYGVSWVLLARESSDELDSLESFLSFSNDLKKESASRF